MRLIDADALADASCSGGVCAECDDMHCGNNVVANCSEVRFHFLKLIKDAPTIEERKEGTWVKMSDADGEYYACSECGEDLPRHIDRTHYCPNCGSYNRGEQDDDRRV